MLFDSLSLSFSLSLSPSLVLCFFYALLCSALRALFLLFSLFVRLFLFLTPPPYRKHKPQDKTKQRALHAAKAIEESLQEGSVIDLGSLQEESDLERGLLCEYAAALNELKVVWPPPESLPSYDGEFDMAKAGKVALAWTEKRGGSGNGGRGEAGTRVVAFGEEEDWDGDDGRDDESAAAEAPSSARAVGSGAVSMRLRLGAAGREGEAETTAAAATAATAAAAAAGAASAEAEATTTAKGTGTERTTATATTTAPATETLSATSATTSKPRLFKCLSQTMQAEELRSQLAASPAAAINTLAAEELDRYGDYDDEDLSDNSDSCFLLCVDGGPAYLWAGTIFSAAAGAEGAERAKGYASALLELLAARDCGDHSSSVELENEGRESDGFWKVFEDGY